MQTRHCNSFSPLSRSEKSLQTGNKNQDRRTPDILFLYGRERKIPFYSSPGFIILFLSIAKRGKKLMKEQLFAEEGSQHAQSRAVNVEHEGTHRRSASCLLHLPSTAVCKGAGTLLSDQELIFFITNRIKHHQALHSLPKGILFLMGISLLGCLLLSLFQAVFFHFETERALSLGPRVIGFPTWLCSAVAFQALSSLPSSA